MFYITSYAFLVRPLGLAREERVFWMTYESIDFF
jgi:hypothetical protein